MLQWLKSKNCPWNARTFMVATGHSTLEVMKWLKAAGCPWGSCTFQTATKMGDLKKMKWLRENGCRWDSNTIGFARLNKIRSRTTVAWLKANGYLAMPTRGWWGEADQASEAER